MCGVAVPVVDSLQSWRWGLAAPVLPAIAVFLLVPRDRTRVAAPSGPKSPAAGLRMGPLLWMSVAFGLAGMTVATVGVFFVPAAESAGLDKATAGVLLAVASFLSIAWRLGVGVFIDRTQRELLGIGARTLVISAVGLALLAAGTVHGLFLVVGLFLVLGPGSGWQVLFLLGVVRLNPGAPAAASGMLMSGGTAAAIVAPFIFGSTAEGFSYADAWLVFAALSLVAAGATAIALRGSMSDFDGVSIDLEGAAP
jgi:cyanate permease